MTNTLQGGDTVKAALHLNVQAFAIEDRLLFPTNALAPMFSKYTGTNVGLNEIVQAATDLQAEYRNRGHPDVSVAVTRQNITNGIVTMTVFKGIVASQILVSGKRYVISANGVQEVVNLPAMTANPSLIGLIGTKTNEAASSVAKSSPTEPVISEPLTPELEALRNKMAELDELERKARARPKDTNPPPVQLILAAAQAAEISPTTDPHEAIQNNQAALALQKRRAQLFPGAATNAPASTNAPFFEVKGYELIGNTLLESDLTDLILRPYIGTNINFIIVRRALTDLQTVYRDRGFATVSVTLPPQQLTNGVVKVHVIEGRLSEIIVENNRYFSSNNVMRALPSLREGIILSTPVFQAELDRANANQDRQIYPQIEPGLEERTTMLRLNVKDQLPLHGKIELNNQSSPGTPELRLNASAVYNNLWQMEHSAGLQYGFSPRLTKTGDQWKFYDRPLVANYSGFYRLPLGDYSAIEEIITTSSSNFGYDEASRKFNLPPPSGRSELNVYASRSTIDTGVTVLSDKTVVDIPGVIDITQKDNQQDLTVSGNVGARLSAPLKTTTDFQSGISGGLDYKTYSLTSSKTNNFLFSIITRDPGGNPNPPVISTVESPNPPPDGATVKQLEYIPLAFRYDASSRDSLGVTAFGLGFSGNLWYSGSVSNLQTIAGSQKATGNWITLTPSLSRDFIFHTNWTLSLRANGQWASEPLISNEQYGAGGVGSVRGYSEGDVFGDAGWTVNMELKTPPHVVGIVYGRQPLTIRGSVFMDYAQTYLSDPQGRPSNTPLWGCGFGGIISVGPHFDARFLFSWPLLSTTETTAGQVHFNFGLTGQF